jgi:hypothetical protein
VRAGARYEFQADQITPENRYYNHLEILALWGSVFGESNLIVREYNRSRLIDGDIRKDFCRLLGINPGHMQFEEEEKNESLDAQCLEVLRHINCTLPEFHESENGWRKAQHIRQFVSTYVPSGESLKTLISQRERTLIKSRFSDINRELNERYFAGRLSRDWFPDCTIADKIAADRERRADVDLASVLRETVICMAEASNSARVKKKRRVKKLLKTLGRSLLNAFPDPH